MFSLAGCVIFKRSRAKTELNAFAFCFRERRYPIQGLMFALLTFFFQHPAALCSPPLREMKTKQLHACFFLSSIPTSVFSRKPHKGNRPGCITAGRDVQGRTRAGAYFCDFCLGWAAVLLASVHRVIPEPRLGGVLCVREARDRGSEPESASWWRRWSSHLPVNQGSP